MTEFSQAIIDEVRQYWDCRPCNIRHSPQPVGTRGYFDEVEVRKYFVELHIPRSAIADYVQYRYVEAWPWSWLPKTEFRGLEKRFDWHLGLTAEVG